ncbi:MAG TPA: DUF5131 family protein [Planctomycetota bacterium]|nr:DUF5131 family protein [Planctomycetota bacterium]
MEDTKIQWVGNTFNPWIGCTKVGPECDFCYADKENKQRRGGMNWGPGAPRSKTGDSIWKAPYNWNRHAAEGGFRHTVFLGSLMDFFDREVDDAGWRDDAWQVIRETPHVDWLVLTKRPNMILDRLPADWNGGYKNVWLGTSVGMRETCWRIQRLLQVPARLHWISNEPMLNPYSLKEACAGAEYPLRWVIFGGESESKEKARPCHVEWIEEGLNECRELGITPFVKQLGTNPFYKGTLMKLKSHKGGEMTEWPEHVRVREFPI